MTRASFSFINIVLTDQNLCLVCQRTEVFVAFAAKAVYNIVDNADF